MGELAAVTIRRQVLDVDLHGSEADGHALQRRLPAVCADVLSPAIESALGAMDPGAGYLYLDRLAIHLTVVSLDGLEAQLAAGVRREIEDHLRQHPLPSAGPSGAANEPGDGQRQTAAQAIDEAVVTFLRSGRLPWSFRLPPGRTLEQLVLEAWSDTAGHCDPPPAIRQGLSAALAVPDARERLVIQFTPEFVMTVLRSLSPEAAALVEQVEAALRGSSPASAAHRTFTRQVRMIAVETAAGGRVRRRPSSVVESAWTSMSPIGRMDRTLAATLERQWPGSTVPAKRPGGVAAEPVPARPATAAKTAPARQATTDPAESGGLLVDCAGLVLLHPFLPKFFEGLGVAAGDELVEPGRAVCLIHHLATGELAAPEHQVTLAKALCGVPLEQPIEADVGLTPAETAEATALLEAAIGHWVALRSTSPDGLRAEFLQRPGVLSVTADGDWLLRVEASTVDILLDQLPWGLSPLWLPWMNGLMMVEWR